MNKLLALAKTKIGCGYVWGSQGEMLTAEKLQWFEKTFGKEHYVFGTSDASKWIGKQVFDCSGLVLWCLQQLGFITASQDYNASMFYHQLCTPLTKSQLVPGDLVFISTNNICHIGIYAGNDKTVEAKGTSAGVVEGNLSSFDLYGRLKFAVGDDTVKPTPVKPVAPTKEQIASNLVDEMIKDQLVADKQYWVDVLTGKIKANPDYLTIAFTRATNKIK